jgi:cellobiose transport system substrate-binding protein
VSNNSKPWHRRPRTALAACAVASLVAGLTACGGGDGDEQSSLGKDDTLTITTFSEFGYDEQIEKWNADPERPFKIKQTKIAEWDTWKESMTKALQAGTELPDVIAVEGDAMAALLAEGANEQFADISDPELDGRWVEYAYKAGQTTDGKQIGYPTDIGPEAMCYRADLFEKAGLPSDPADAAALFRTGTPTTRPASSSSRSSPRRSGTTPPARSRRPCSTRSSSRSRPRTRRSTSRTTT